jgi:hypothetical protein
MRFRTGMLIGLAVGYYYGSKAGRERYLQIEEWLDRIRSTTTFQEARTKLSDGVREGTAAARRLVEDTLGDGDAPDVELNGRPVADPTYN